MVMESTGKTPENAHEAMRLIDEIIAKEKSHKTAVFRRLGISGIAFTQLANRTGCTNMMLERVRTEHARVCGAAVASKAAKSGLIVAPREEPAPAAEEPEEEIEEEGEDESDERDDEDESDESEPAPSPKPARAAPVRAKAATAKPAPKPSPALSLSQEQMLDVLVQLTRCAAAVERLGGIERAERIAAAIGGAL